MSVKRWMRAGDPLNTATGQHILGMKKPTKLSRQGGARSGPHTDLVKACLQWFELHHITAWKMNTGAFATKTGGFVRAGFPGCPDIIGVMPGTGKFLAVECKTGRGELSKDQRATRDLIIIDGGVFVEARSVDDLEWIRRG